MHILEKQARWERLWEGKNPSMVHALSDIHLPVARGTERRKEVYYGRWRCTMKEVYCEAE